MRTKSRSLFTERTMIDVETYPVEIYGETHNDRMAVLMSFFNDFPDVSIRSLEDDGEEKIVFFLKARPNRSRLDAWLTCIAEEHQKAHVVCEDVKGGDGNEVVG